MQSQHKPYLALCSAAYNTLKRYGGKLPIGFIGEVVGRQGSEVKLFLYEMEEAGLVVVNDRDDTVELFHHGRDRSKAAV